MLNPYTLALSEKRLSRLLAKLDRPIEAIEKEYYLDKDRFQLLLESHWLSHNASSGQLTLPSWDLYMFQAGQSESILADKDIQQALKEVTAELRN